MDLPAAGQSQEGFQRRVVDVPGPEFALGQVRSGCRREDRQGRRGVRDRIELVERGDVLGGLLRPEAGRMAGPRRGEQAVRRRSGGGGPPPGSGRSRSDAEGHSVGLVQTLHTETPWHPASRAQPRMIQSPRTGHPLPILTACSSPAAQEHPSRQLGRRDEESGRGVNLPDRPGRRQAESFAAIARSALSHAIADHPTESP